MDKKLILIAAGSAVGGLLAGGGLGYVLTKRKLGKEFDARLDYELERAFDSFQRRYKEGPYADPITATKTLLTQAEIDALPEPTIKEQQEDLNALRERIQQEQYDQRNSDEFSKEIADLADPSQVDDDEPVVQSLWDKPQPDPSELGEGIPQVIRDPEKPFVIPLSEFMEAEENTYERLSITYYEKDDTLADERDQPVPNPTEVIGNALEMFGVGTPDPDQVYVRNDRIHTFIEITRDKRSYDEAVIGLDTEDQEED